MGVAEKLRSKLGRDPTAVEIEAERARKRKKREEKAGAAQEATGGGDSGAEAAADTEEAAAPPAKKQRAAPRRNVAADSGDGGKKRKVRRPAPGGLKRPPSAYILFLSSKRAKVRQDNPAASMIEITKLLAQKWNALSDDRKAKYNSEAAEKKAEWEKAKANLPPSPPPAAAPAAAGATLKGMSEAQATASRMSETARSRLKTYSKSKSHQRI